MASITVLDSTGTTRTITYPDAGRSAAASSSPVVLSTEDKASLDAVGTKLDTLNGLVGGTDSQLPSTLGAKTGANSLSVVLASDQAAVSVSPNVTRGSGVVDANTTRVTLATDGTAAVALTNIDADIGAQADAAATTDTGTFSLVALVKRALTNWTTLLARIPALVGGRIPVDGSGVTQPVSGSVSVTGVATETTLTAINGKVPAQGQAAMAGSLPVVLASNQSTVPVVEPAVFLTGASAQTATVNNILDSVAGATGTDVVNARSMSVQVTSTGTGGTFIFEQSNDNTNWVALPVFNAALVTGVPITSAITATASSIIYTMPLRSRWVRLRIASTITGGSIQAWSRISSEPWTAAAQLVASNTAANLAATVSGSVTVSGTVTSNIGTGSIAAGTNAIGDVGVQYRANATGAASATHFVSAATTNAAQVKSAGAGRVLGWVIANNSASWRYVKLHNQTATPTAGTGVVRTIGVPPNGMAQLAIEGGIAFTTGIAMTIVAGAADADATAIGANEVVGEIIWA